MMASRRCRLSKAMGARLIPMYERLLDKYWVFFEGLPEPVFYGRFYPMGRKEGLYRQQLWDDFHYARGLKMDKPTDDNDYSVWRDSYEQDLRDLLNNVYSSTRGMRRGVVVIPSSTNGVVNRVTGMVRSVLSSNRGVYSDLTYHVTRIRSKQKAHAGGGRSYDGSFDTIGVAEGARIEQLDVILVIDDILTSGMSFRAMDDKLRAEGFKGTIVNFAFLRTLPSECATLLMQHRELDAESEGFTSPSKAQYENHPIDALILDLDQTLLDDHLRIIEYEGWLNSSERGAGIMPYLPYAGVRDMTELCIPYAIVSNRPERQLARLMMEPPLSSVLYPHLDAESFSGKDGRSHLQNLSRGYAAAPGNSWRDPIVPRNVFSFPVDESNGFKLRYYKPSPRGVTNAAGYIRDTFLGGQDDARIVGLGNTHEDMVAYREAGIESVLALWGVPQGMRSHARHKWGADHAFDSFAAFNDWVKSTRRYHEMARKVEWSNPELARRCYELAIRCGDNTGDSAFRLARMVREVDPPRATQLYEIAVATGNVLAANDLGVLILSDDPARAASLFEWAIAAGEERYATRNLALLIGSEDPTRAVTLLKRAAQAGNSRGLARDLTPLVRNGCEDAADLYEELIIATDERLANNLADLLRQRDAKKAMRLYERAIDAGDEFHATYNLGTMLMNDEPGRAKELFERALSAGNVRQAANALGVMIAGEDANRARDLFLQAIAAGDIFYATVHLAHLIREEDSEWALELLEMSVRAGRKDDGLGIEILWHVRKNNTKAISLYHIALISKDERKANDLAEHIKSFAPKWAEKLYQRAINAGDERYATCNLGTLVMNENPMRAEALFRRAIAAGDELRATNNLAIIVAHRDLGEALSLLERSIDAGSDAYAPCNLAHLLIPTDQERATSLYEQSAAHGELEAQLGLAYLLREEYPTRSQELLSLALRADNKDSAVKFMLKFTGCANVDRALDVALFLLANGFDAAEETILSSALGTTYDDENGTVLIGKSPKGSKALRWKVIGLDRDGILLLCDEAVTSMPFCENAPATWKNSAIRSWLNTVFRREWLGDVNDDWLVPHAETGDSVFCLDTTEFESAMSKRADLLPCRDRDSGRPTGWWMRIDENDTMSAPCVMASNEKGWKVALWPLGVRPAVRVSLQ